MTERTDHEIAEVPASFRYVPPFPERTGYHWLRRFRGGPATPLWWNAVWHQNGGDGWGKWAQPDREDKWEYCGPCPSPDDNLRDGGQNYPDPADRWEGWPDPPTQGPKQHGWPVGARICDCVTGEPEPQPCHCDRASSHPSQDRAT